MVVDFAKEAEQKDMDWLDSVKAPIELAELKGTVTRILQPREVETKDYGKRKLIELVIQGKEGEVIASEFLPDQFPLLTPNSNLGKILKKYSCGSLRELIGKEVELVIASQGNLKIKKE